MARGLLVWMIGEERWDDIDEEMNSQGKCSVRMGTRNQKKEKPYSSVNSLYSRLSFCFIPSASLIS